MSAYAAAREICSRHARTFYFASRFLPEVKRLRAYAVYGFCRMIDDAVDADDDALAAGHSLEERLAAFAGALDQIYNGDVNLPGLRGRDEARLALRAFAQTVHDCNIPKQYFLELAQGCKMDLTVKRYESWPGLENYCYHVAGVVGLIMCKVFEVDHPEAPAKAVAMGNAMQLTNILRDVSEDWARGRVYLPQDEMRDGGVTEADLSQGKSTPALRVFICKQVARARELYQQGAQGLKLIPDDGSRLTACAMASIYGGILGAIEKKDYDVFSGRAKLNIWQKLVRVPGIYKLRRNTRDPRRDVLQGLAGWPS